MNRSEPLQDYLLSLYQQCEPDNYINSHGSSHVISEKTRIFKDYFPYVKNFKVLDFGCRQADDSCLMRVNCEELEIHGCDIIESPIQPFADGSRLKYTRLNHSYLLPYSDNLFDTVVASGSIEHVPNELETLKELYRILKPDGRLIITHLPNKWSIAEWILPFVLKARRHSRRYSVDSISNLLLSSGFIPEKVFKYSTIPISRFNHYNSLSWLVDHVWPLNLFANIFTVISKKVIHL